MAILALIRLHNSFKRALSQEEQGFWVAQHFMKCLVYNIISFSVKKHYPKTKTV